MVRAKKTVSAKAKKAEQLEKARKYHEKRDQIYNYATNLGFVTVVSGMLSEAIKANPEDPWKFMVEYILVERNMNFLLVEKNLAEESSSSSSSSLSAGSVTPTDHVGMKSEAPTITTELVLNPARDEFIGEMEVQEIEPIPEMKLNSFETVVDDEPSQKSELSSSLRKLDELAPPAKVPRIEISKMECDAPECDASVIAEESNCESVDMDLEKEKSELDEAMPEVSGDGDGSRTVPVERHCIDTLNDFEPDYEPDDDL